MSMEGEYWEFEARNSGQAEIVLAVLKKLTAEDVKFWKGFLISHLDHYIETLESEPTREKQ